MCGDSHPWRPGVRAIGICGGAGDGDGVKKQSFMRQVKRRAMKDAGLNWTQRLMKSLGTGKPVPTVEYKREGKTIVAKEVV